MNQDILIQNVQLLGGGVLFQQLGCHAALGGQDDAILGQDANGCAGVRNGLEGILDLVETAFGGEDGSLRRMVSCLACFLLCVVGGGRWMKLELEQLPGSSPSRSRRLTRESYLRDMVADGPNERNMRAMRDVKESRLFLDCWGGVNRWL